ncbi:MAG: hypothetical protein WBB33_02790 [Candidatus Saccharimonadales bacterium]
MKKKSTKLKKPKFKRSLSPKVVIPVLIVLAVLAFYVVPRIVDYTKFMTLKHDMLAIQSEFNKIDPGWEYSESCHTMGEKYKDSIVSSCYVELTINKEVNSDIYSDKLVQNTFTKLFNPYKFENDGDKVISYQTTYNNNKDVVCGYSLREKISTKVVKTIFGCHDLALDFYFPRSQ